MSGSAMKRINRDMDDKIAKLPTTVDSIGSIVNDKMSKITSIGVKDINVESKMNASSMDVGDKTLVVDSENSSLGFGGRSLNVNPTSGSTFETSITSKAELLTSHKFAFDRDTVLNADHVVVMDEDRIEFNDKVKIRSGGLDVTGGDALFDSDVNVVGNLKTGTLDSTRHTTTTGVITTPTISFSQSSIEMHKPIIQSSDELPLELRSKDIKSRVQVSDTSVRMDYPSSASEIIVEYGGVTVSGGYGKNTNVFGNLFVNGSVHDNVNASGDALSGKVICNGVTIKPENDTERDVLSSVGVYQTKYRMSKMGSVFVYNGVKELNPISENKSIRSISSEYKLYDKNDDNSNLWETTQFLSKRLLNINDVISINDYNDDDGTLKKGVFVVGSSGLSGVYTLIAESKYHPFENETYRVVSKKTVSVELLMPDGSSDPQGGHKLVAFVKIRKVVGGSDSDEKWIYNPAQNKVIVSLSPDSGGLILRDVFTGELLNTIYMGEEYEFDTSSKSLNEYDRLHFTKYVGSNIEYITGVCSGCLSIAKNSEGWNVGYSAKGSVLISEETNEVTIIPIACGKEGSMTGLFVNRMFMINSQTLYCYLIKKTGRIDQLDMTDPTSLNVKVTSVTNKLATLANFIIPESHERISVRPSYFIEDGRWKFNDSITDSVIVYGVFDIPTEIKFTRLVDDGDIRDVDVDDLTIQYTFRTSVMSQYMITIAIHLNILGVSQYNGCWYKDIYHATGTMSSRNVPRKYKPMLSVGYYVRDYYKNGTISEWRSNFKKIPCVGGDYLKTSVTNFDIENYWLNNVYLQEKESDINEGSEISYTYSTVYNPSNGDIIGMDFYPAIRIMGVAIELQKSDGDIFMKIAEIS